MTHCLTEFTQCSFDTQCMDILNCLNDCEPSDAECSFTCGMGSEAGKNPNFVKLLKCMVDNGCLDKYDDSGVCLATDQEALPITDFELVSFSNYKLFLLKSLDCRRLVDSLGSKLWSRR